MAQKNATGWSPYTEHTKDTVQPAGLGQVRCAQTRHLWLQERAFRTALEGAARAWQKERSRCLDKVCTKHDPFPIRPQAFALQTKHDIDATERLFSP